jgi:Ras-related protein Rab-1A
MTTAAVSDNHDLDYDAKGYDLMFKILVLGESGVGKSCLLVRFAENTFSDVFISTVGVDFKFRNVELDDKVIKLQVWDTAGQERFRTITSSFYRGAQGIILVYDVTDRKSFERVDVWVNQISTYAPAVVPVVLCGNKSDLVAKRVVDYFDAKAVADKHGWKYFETSAKDGSNVKEAFVALAAMILPRVSTPTKPQKTKQVNSNNGSGNGGCCTIV